ncbi:MAG: hypothetical protein EPO07_07565 [Verrucomicrobia bacterium]|nr:MAG: hypothetical protein EPO07_07565 [Verrucomicrobiota bacterium]
MKNIPCRLGLVSTLAVLLFSLGATPAVAQDRGDSGARLERLERRVNEMAERQEQMLQRMENQMERRRALGQQPGENARQPLPPLAGPAAGVRDPNAARHAKGLHDLLGLLFLIGCLCNILLAIWIYTDIRKRNEGSGIFVAMAMVAGIPAALIYALTRIGDKKT